MSLVAREARRVVILRPIPSPPRGLQSDLQGGIRRTRGGLELGNQRARSLEVAVVPGLLDCLADGSQAHRAKSGAGALEGVGFLAGCLGVAAGAGGADRRDP